MMPRARTIAALVGALATLTSCDAAPTGNDAPTPGTLKAVLTSPNADAAILIRVDGLSVSNIAVSGTGRTAFTRTLSDSSVLIAIIGPVASGEQFQFDVPNVKAATSYTALVLDVSDSTNTLRASLSDYVLRVQR